MNNNSHLRKLFFFILLSLPISLILIFSYFRFSKISNILSPQITVTHSSPIYDPNFFTQAQAKAKDYMSVQNITVKGGIIPHHLLAAPLVSGFFEGIKNQRVKTFILIGPNHRDIGANKIITSKASWKTVFGEISPDMKIIDQLTKSKIASVEENVFETEHSIFDITPFIKNTFPQAQIVPIILKSNTQKEDCDRLANAWVSLLLDDDLVLASTDFSHNSTSSEAEMFDKESITAIKSFDLEKILKLDSTKNVDSPAAIYTLLKTLELKGARGNFLIAETDSLRLPGGSPQGFPRGVEPVTSYVSMYFFAGNNFTPDEIFRYRSPETLEKSNDKNQFVLLVTGDVIPARSVNAQMTRRNNFNYPFENTAEFLRKGDLVFINLESPLIPDCPVTEEGIIFCGNQKAIDGLKYAGVRVASLANNHAGNYGEAGIDQTGSLLKRAGIAVTGPGTPAVLETKGRTFGFLAYNDVGEAGAGIMNADPVKIATDVANLKRRVDFVVTLFHWGIEYTSYPTERQKELAHTAIDAGADLVVGNHPHWVQGVEFYKGKMITYAHGNFVFDQMWSRETREGVIGGYVFDKNGLKAVSFYPVIIENFAQPRFATEKEATIILDRMKKGKKITSGV